MEKLIFKKIIKDISLFLFISITCVATIVWIIQAVNYLDLVSEDGHSFKVYFFYTLLSFPKIFARLMLFMFFLSVFYTIIKYEEKNELIIFWVNGVKKSVFLNFIVKFSIIIFFLQLFLNIFIVPKAQDLGRSFIRSSNIDYLPSLIKSKKFINAVEKLTIFIEKKDNDGNLINIFINDLNNVSISKSIFAKKGEIIKQDNNYYFILSNGNIIENSKSVTPRSAMVCRPVGTSKPAKLYANPAIKNPTIGGSPIRLINMPKKNANVTSVIIIK